MQNGSDFMKIINEDKICEKCFAFVQFEKQNKTEEKGNCATFLFGYCKKID